MEQNRIRPLRRLLLGAAAAAALALTAALPVAAHAPHEAANGHQGDGQVVANGQNHPVFKDLDADGKSESCVSYGPLIGLGETEIGPSWYGIETAHHGPDSGDPGNDPNEGVAGDTSCYETDSNPTADVANPALR